MPAHLIQKKNQKTEGILQLSEYMEDFVIAFLFREQMLLPSYNDFVLLGIHALVLYIW